MGTAIARRPHPGRRTLSSIISHRRDQGEATVAGDLVDPRRPVPRAVTQSLAAYGDQLAGKIVVDITNPVYFETFDSLTVPAGSSAAAELAATAAVLPGAQGVQHQLRRHAGQQVRW